VITKYVLLLNRKIVICWWLLLPLKIGPSWTSFYGKYSWGATGYALLNNTVFCSKRLLLASALGLLTTLVFVDMIEQILLILFVIIMMILSRFVPLYLNYGMFILCTSLSLGHLITVVYLVVLLLRGVRAENLFVRIHTRFDQMIPWRRNMLSELLLFSILLCRWCSNIYL